MNVKLCRIDGNRFVSSFMDGPKQIEYILNQPAFDPSDGGLAYWETDIDDLYVLRDAMIYQNTHLRKYETFALFECVCDYVMSYSGLLIAQAVEHRACRCLELTITRKLL